MIHEITRNFVSVRGSQLLTQKANDETMDTLESKMENEKWKMMNGKKILYSRLH